MKIKSRVGTLLQEHGIRDRGVIKDLAKITQCSRQTISKILSGNAKKLDLEVLGKIAAYLIDHGVPGKLLPGALIGRDALWDHMRLAQRIVIWLGEYEPDESRLLARSVIARRDAVVANNLLQQLARNELFVGRNLEIRYIPVKYTIPEKDAGRKQTYVMRLEDRNRADIFFNELRELRPAPEPSVVFYIGSQRINLLVEKLVASCFNQQPFTETLTSKPVPFFLLYRKADPVVPSCFGGVAMPRGVPNQTVPGIYFRTKRGGWAACPEREGKTTGGVVLVTYQRASQSLEVALFGFSGEGTAAVGEYFLSHADEFWPPNAELAGRQVGVHICRFTETGAGRTCVVETLPKAILEEFAR